MITKISNHYIMEKIDFGLFTETALSAKEIVDINQVKKDRLKELFARLFQVIEVYGYFVHRMVISPQVMYLIRLTDYKDFPFNESTRKELQAIGIVGDLWTSQVYIDKDCVGIVLYSIEDSDKITDDYPNIKAKWDAIKKDNVD